MPEPISLISSTAITPEEFAYFLHYGGVQQENDNIYDGRLSDGDLHVWIALDNRELQIFEEDEIKLITKKLGGVPVTHILLDISETPGSEKLAIDLARVFAQKWNCVIYESRERIYSPQETLIA